MLKEMRSKWLKTASGGEKAKYFLIKGARYIVTFFLGLMIVLISSIFLPPADIITGLQVLFAYSISWGLIMIGMIVIIKKLLKVEMKMVGYDKSMEKAPLTMKERLAKFAKEQVKEEPKKEKKPKEIIPKGRED